MANESRRFEDQTIDIAATKHTRYAIYQMTRLLKAAHEAVAGTSA